MMEIETSSELIAKEIKNLSPHVHPPVPNPAPLGLIGFGLTTALLQMKHTRLTGATTEETDGVDALTLGFAMFFGGLLQLLAGLGEVKRNNIFGYTAFCLYGGFWMSVGLVEIIQIIGPVDTPAVNAKALQTMLSLVGIYTAMLFVNTFRMNMTISLLFFLLMTTLFLLAGGAKNEIVDRVAGWFGLLTAAVAYWLAFAELINDIYGGGKEVIPLGHWPSNKQGAQHGGSHVAGRIHGVGQRAALKKLSPSVKADLVPESQSIKLKPEPAKEEDVEAAV